MIIIIGLAFLGGILFFSKSDQDGTVKIPKSNSGKILISENSSWKILWEKSLLDEIYKNLDKELISIFDKAYKTDKKNTERAYSDFMKWTIPQDFFADSLRYIAKEKTFSSSINQYITNLQKKWEKIQDRTWDYLFGMLLSEAWITPESCAQFLSPYSGSVSYAFTYSICLDQTFFNSFIKAPSVATYEKAKQSKYILTNSDFYKKLLDSKKWNIVCSNKKDILCPILLKKLTFQEFNEAFKSSILAVKKTDFTLSNYGILSLSQDVSIFTLDQTIEIFYQNIYLYRVKIENSQPLCADIKNVTLLNHCNEMFSRPDDLKKQYLALAQEYRIYRYIYWY